MVKFKKERTLADDFKKKVEVDLRRAYMTEVMGKFNGMLSRMPDELLDHLKKADDKGYKAGIDDVMNFMQTNLSFRFLEEADTDHMMKVLGVHVGSISDASGLDDLKRKLGLD